MVNGNGTLVHRPGDFRLVSITGHVGRAIRIGQWLNGDGFENYEHAQVYLGNGLFMDAQPGGATPHMYDNLDTGLWSSGLIPLTTMQRDAIVRAAYTYKGVPYAFMDYGVLAAHRLHIYAPHMKKYVESSGHMICSQLVDQCYVDGKVHLFTDKRWPGDVTPGDLTRVLLTIQMGLLN